MTLPVRVIYNGTFEKMDLRIPGYPQMLRFDRGVPREVDPSLHEWFARNPSGHFLVGRFHDAVPTEEAKHVLIRRLGALGDLVTLHGALSSVHRVFPGRYRFTVQMMPDYVMFMSRSRWLDPVPLGAGFDSIAPIDRMLVLDGVFEADHQPGGPRDSRVQRVWYELYKGTKIEFPQDVRPDFSMELPEADMAWARATLKPALQSGKPIVAVALQARTITARTPNPAYSRRVCEELWRLGYWLVFFEGSIVTWARPDQSTVLTGSSMLQATAALHYCDVAITPDSGSMWLVHVAGIPLVYWGGPTPGTVKCIHHPLYPEGVVLVQTNDWINCPACFEDAQACEKQYTCMKWPDPDRFVNETVLGVERMYSYGAKKKSGATK